MGNLKNKHFHLMSFIMLFLIVSPIMTYAEKTITIQVDVLSKSDLVLNLTKGQSFYASLSIDGGSDMAFYIVDPSGAIVLGSPQISGGRKFMFKAEKDGLYSLTFDNSISSISQKTVTFSYSVSAPLILGFELFPFSLIVVLIVIDLIFAGFLVYNWGKFPEK